jgi:hypothetical protein
VAPTPARVRAREPDRLRLLRPRVAAPVLSSSWKPIAASRSKHSICGGSCATLACFSAMRCKVRVTRIVYRLRQRCCAPYSFVCSGVLSGIVPAISSVQMVVCERTCSLYACAVTVVL